VASPASAEPFSAGEREADDAASVMTDFPMVAVKGPMNRIGAVRLGDVVGDVGGQRRPLAPICPGRAGCDDDEKAIGGPSGRPSCVTSRKVAAGGRGDAPTILPVALEEAWAQAAK